MATKTPILPGNYYHLYNHANGGLDIFRNDENFRFFLKKYIKFVHPFVDTFAYCLMPNHFHFLIRVKEEFEEGSDLFGKTSDFSDKDQQYKKSDVLAKPEPSNPITPKQVTNAIKNWLISYTRSYNKVYKNRGNLYHQHIKRKIIKDEDYFKNLVVYIHFNPVIHGFTLCPEDWDFSSFLAYMTNMPSLVKRQQIFELFGGKNDFLFHHRKKIDDQLSKSIDLDF